MFKQGDIIEMKEDVQYMVTVPGTRLMIYDFPSDQLVRIGTPPIYNYKSEDMIRLYGDVSDSHHIRRRMDAGIKFYTVRIDEIKMIGNNLIFKNHLLQGDMWEEPEKQKTWSRGRPRYSADWADLWESPFE
jgi:hypothetical protein